MARTHNPGKRAAERRFKFHIDVPIPAGGLGNRLNEMHDWCRANIAAGAWAMHGHTEKQSGQIARDYTRVYFLIEEDADLFRWR